MQMSAGAVPSLFSVSVVAKGLARRRHGRRTCGLGGEREAKRREQGQNCDELLHDTLHSLLSSQAAEPPNGEGPCDVVKMEELASFNKYPFGRRA